MVGVRGGVDPISVDEVESGRWRPKIYLGDGKCDDAESRVDTEARSSNTSLSETGFISAI